MKVYASAKEIFEDKMVRLKKNFKAGRAIWDFKEDFACYMFSDEGKSVMPKLSGNLFFEDSETLTDDGIKIPVKRYMLDVENYNEEQLSDATLDELYLFVSMVFPDTISDPKYAMTIVNRIAELENEPIEDRMNFLKLFSEMGKMYEKAEKIIGSDVKYYPDEKVRAIMLGGREFK